MSAGAGPSILPEHTAALESLIDEQGILDTPEEREAKQRTDDDSNNTRAGEEETGIAPILDEPGEGDGEEDETPLAAEGEQGGEEGEQGGEGVIDDDGIITTVEGLAEVLEAEPDDILDSIEFDNGLGASIPLRQVVDSWRDTTVTLNARQEQMEVAHQTQLSELNGKVDTQLNEMTSLTQALIAEMQAELSGVDMDTLKQTDPDRAFALIEKQQRVRQLVAKSAEQLQFTAKDRSEQSSADIERMQMQQANLLAQKMPHWAKNPKVVREVVGENHALMTGLGFSAEEINGVVDHREIIILHWAAQYRKSLRDAKSKTFEQLAKDKPGLRRPGLASRATARTDAPDPGVTDRNKRTARFKKSGTVKDAASVLETMFK